MFSVLRRSVLLTVLACLLLAGCDPSFTRPQMETPDALAATAILNPYADRQALLLTKVEEEQPLEGEFNLVQNATVRIGDVSLENRPADSVRIPNRFPQDTNYRTDTLDVKPGTIYTLTAEKGAYDLTGTVAVPDTFVGWAEGRRLVWTESEGAARYQVHVEDAADTPFEFRDEYTVSDTSVLIGTDGLTLGAYYVEVYAQDPNLVAFMQNETDRAGVTGGYGLFGARTLIAGTVEFSGRQTAGAPGDSTSSEKTGAPAPLRMRPSE